LRCDAPGGSGGCAFAAVIVAAIASAPRINLRNRIRITVSFMEQSFMEEPHRQKGPWEAVMKRWNGVQSVKELTDLGSRT
jgi:hypothetical protein